MKHDIDPIHSTWLSSEKRLPARFIRPVIQFTEVEAAGGIVLLIAAAVALIWANSPLYESYFTFINTHIEISGAFIHLDETIKELVNDGLMAVFFFVVGLEIKRELTVGELNSRKKAALPAMAALGGMIVPALIYVAIVAGGGASNAIDGWGIPMATDIAFSVGIVALLGSRVSVSAKLFLLALAIVDDIGAILVIAIFYTDDLSFQYLIAGIVAIIAIYVARRAGITSLLFYTPAAILVWFLFLESGVHATIAGVILGLMTPVHAKYTDETFRQKAVAVLDRWDMNRASPNAEARLDQDALELSAVAKSSVSPLNRLEIALHPWSSFVIVPLFALVNAGVRFVGTEEGFIEQALHPVALGVAVGLTVGKPLGIAAATWLGLKLKLGELPRRTTMQTIVGLGLLAGVGFTVSLFIAELAFMDPATIDEAKLGIFIGSGVAGVLGYLALRRTPVPEDEYEDSPTGLPRDPT